LPKFHVVLFCLQSDTNRNTTIVTDNNVSESVTLTRMYEHVDIKIEVSVKL